MTTRRRNVLLLFAVLVAGGLGAWLLAPAVRERAAVDAIPSGAFLVVTIDLEKARNSPLAHELSELRELGDISEQCGFDALAHVRSVAVGVPEKPDGVFGLAFTHDLSEDDLGKCAQRMMSLRSATPRFTQRGSWIVLEQEGLIAEATRSKIAYRSGSPVLVARGDYLATMQGALDGQNPRAVAESEHTALRKVAARDGAIAIATAVLPKSIRDRIRNEMEGETSPDKASTMSAVLAVRAVAFSIAAHADRLDVFGELECETDAACATLHDFLERKRKSIAEQPAARFVGIGGILDAAHIDVRGPSLDVTVSAPETEMARAVRAVVSSAFSPAPIPKARSSSSGFSPPP